MAYKVVKKLEWKGKKYDQLLNSIEVKQVGAEKIVSLAWSKFVEKMGYYDSDVDNSDEREDNEKLDDSLF